MHLTYLNGSQDVIAMNWLYIYASGIVYSIVMEWSTKSTLRIRFLTWKQRTASRRPRTPVTIDWSTRSIDGSNLAIEVQIHQINWPPKDIFRWKLLK